MKHSKEQQEEIKQKNPSSVISAKKQRETIEQGRRDLRMKIRDTKGTFHVKIGTIKDRNSMDLTEADDIKKRWQEHT